MSLIRECLPLLTVCASLALAQTPTGILTGKIVDITGGGIANARVELTSETIAGRRIVANADSDGDFKFPDLQTGEYVLRSFMPGFQSLTIKSIAIEADGERKLPTVQLEVGFCGQGRRPIDYMRFRSEQTDTGGLGGRVQVDEGPLKGNSQPIVDAVVRLLCSKGGICATTRTDHNGEFSFSNIYPGDASLLIRQRGFYPLDETGFRVETGRELTYLPVYLKKCPSGRCNPAKRPRKVAICE
jgi:Carboxypeptidase regulatory-like domain